MLGSSPLYMDGRMMAAIPWEKDLNSKPIGPNDLPMWIALLAMDPLLEIHVTFLLKQVGKMDFSSTSASLSKFANIYGYVLLNLDNPILGQVDIDMVDEGTIRVEVAYRSLLFTYDHYHEKGHPKELCIRRRREYEWTQLVNELEQVK